MVSPIHHLHSPSLFTSSLTCSTGLLHEGNIDQVPRTLTTYRGWEYLIYDSHYRFHPDPENVHKEDHTIQVVLEWTCFNFFQGASEFPGVCQCLQNTQKASAPLHNLLKNFSWVHHTISSASIFLLKSTLLTSVALVVKPRKALSSCCFNFPYLSKLSVRNLFEDGGHLLENQWAEAPRPIT